MGYDWFEGLYGDDADPYCVDALALISSYSSYVEYLKTNEDPLALLEALKASVTQFHTSVINGYELFETVVPVSITTENGEIVAEAEI